MFYSSLRTNGHIVHRTSGTGMALPILPYSLSGSGSTGKRASWFSVHLFNLSSQSHFHVNRKFTAPTPVHKAFQLFPFRDQRPVPKFPLNLLLLLLRILQSCHIYSHDAGGAKADCDRCLCYILMKFLSASSSSNADCASSISPAIN